MKLGRGADIRRIQTPTAPTTCTSDKIRKSSFGKLNLKNFLKLHGIPKTGTVKIHVGLGILDYAGLRFPNYAGLKILNCANLGILNYAGLNPEIAYVWKS